MIYKNKSIYFIEKIPSNSKNYTLPEHILHHLRVRRELEIGFKFIISDNEFFIEAVIAEISKKNVTLSLDTLNLISKCEKKITLYQSILKPDNMSYVMQKATEFGVYCIQPILAERSQHHYWTDKSKEHYLKILQSAATQSKQLYYPMLKDPISLKNLSLEDNNLYTLNFNGRKWSSSETVLNEISFLIGPEGGWTENEEKFLNKVQTLSLSSTVLRAETAALACMALATCL